MINKLSIENFKCFLHPTEFQLSSLNIFTGYNGRGKSSVFQTLLLLGQSFIKNGNIEKLEVNGNFVRLDLFEDLLYKDSSIRRKDKMFFNLETDVSEYRSIEVGYKEYTERTGKICQLKINDIDYFQEASSIGGGKEEATNKSLYTYPKHFHALFSNFNYVSADRLGPTLFEEKDEISFINPLNSNGDHRLNILSRNGLLLEATNEWLNYIMDGGNVSINGLDKKSAVLGLHIDAGNGSKDLKSINCGFGYSYILSVIIVLLSTEEGCIFIENPEAHLHPLAQARLMELVCEQVKKKNIQVFIETHSEHIINRVRLCTLKKEFSITNKDVSLYFFDKDYRISSLTIDEDGQVSNWPIGFFDQQENDLREILKLGLFRNGC